MAQYVDVKGFGLVEFPDGISRETMLQALQRRFSQMPANASGATVEPYTPSLAERADGGISSALQRTGLISNPYQANRIGENITMGLEALPVIGDAIGGDELGRAIREGDMVGGGFAALGAIPIAGDAVKGLKVFRGQPAGSPLRVNDDGLLWVTPDRNYAADPHYGGKQGAEVLEGVIPEANVFDYSMPGSREFLIAEAKKRGVSRPLARDAASGNFRALKDKEITSIIKDAGFDGFKAVEPEGQSSIALFDTGKFQLNPQQNPLAQVGEAGKALRGSKVIASVSDLFDYTPDMLARQLKESDPSKVVGDVWRDQKRAFYTDYLPDGSAAMYKNDGTLIKRMEADEARNLYRNRILEIEMQKPEAQAILEQRRLADEAASKAQQQASESDYRMMHRAPTRDGNQTADDLSTLFDDIYGPNALRLNSTGVPYDRKAIQLIQSMRGNPEKEITIYRAVPKGVTDINQGDWVTATKEYAEQHAKYDPNYVVISKKVRAKDIATDGNSIHEFGYDPQQ